MHDIITPESLRATADNISPTLHIYPSDVLRDAATEIERLTAVNADLLAALKALLPDGWGDDDTMDHIPGVKQARAVIARAEPPGTDQGKDAT